MRRFVFYFLMLFAYIQVEAQCTLPQMDFSQCNYIPFGHRAYSAVYPENTLMAIEELFKCGVKFTEVDVSLTKDDVYVLFHDESTVYRTTNGKGDLDSYTYAELQLLDAGGWRGDAFKGLRIPKLADAIRLAEKYDAQLYLDCKSYDPDAMKVAIEEAGASPHRILPSIATLADAADFRAVLPNTPWIWYSAGNYPTDVKDVSFYAQCMQLGCYAFEIGEYWVGDTSWLSFRDNVHAAGGKVLVFTVNNENRMRALVDAGVDAIESDRPWESGRFICYNEQGVSYDSLTTANYLFNGNLFSTHVGSQIRSYNYIDPPLSQQPSFASCSVFGVPMIEGENKVVMKVPAFDPANGLMVFNNFRVEEFGVLDQSFTVIMDLLLPASSTGKWVSLFQSSTRNWNDADLFINPSGKIGISESYHGLVTPNVWHRITFSVDGLNLKINKYLNGQFIGATPISDAGRWAVWNSSRSGDDQGFLMFADDDNETSELYVSALQVRNYVVDSSVVRMLGAPKSNGIAMGNTDCWQAELAGSIKDSTILDYEHKTYYFLIPHDMDADSAWLKFKLFDASSSNIEEQKYIPIKNGTYTWNITSEDGAKTQQWKACIRKASPQTGLQEQLLSLKNIKVFPVPANQLLQLEGLPKHSIQFKLFDMMGRLQQSGITNGQMDVSMLYNGVYVLVLENDGLMISKKIIVQH
ncbi:MAG: glycerophosphodiester phosphodiesterase family protein [Bacteroidota bacterium]|jgi:glycerophosphoryl diester phosphodiesterase